MKQWNGEEFVNEWHGYHMDEGRFMGQPYVVICPKEGTANGQWALKTEYFGAFPQLELDLLARGYHLAHVKTYERYCPPPVTELQACFVDFVSRRYGLSPKCVPIGMSCGGMQAIYLAGKHPDKVACAYIDAPVVNFLSVPFCMGKRNASNAIEKFEAGRQTPTKEQQEKMANYFGVSMFYLKGESNDRTRMETWMDAAYNDDEPVFTDRG